MSHRIKKILCIFAHREDHIIFGWPILQSNVFLNHFVIDKYLITATKECETLKNNSCIQSNTQYLGNANLNNGFSYPHRNLDSNRKLLRNNYCTIKAAIESTMPNNNFDYIFCHNPMGEYGHHDHKLIFEVVYNEFAIPIIITDITAKSNYHKFHDQIPKMYKHFYQKKIDDIEPDLNFYQKYKIMYEKYGRWTKNENLNTPIYPKSAGLYLINV